MVDDGEKPKRLVFSGDLGPKNAPILRDYEPLRQTDLAVLESTYGDREHQPLDKTVAKFTSIVIDAVSAGGKILVTTVAVGPAQLLVLLLSQMFRGRLVQPFPIFFDSPMAIAATEIYRHHHELFENETLIYIAQKPAHEDFPSLKSCVTAEDSKKINDQPGPCLVMASAGMSSGGRTSCITSRRTSGSRRRTSSSSAVRAPAHWAGGWSRATSSSGSSAKKSR